jgi:hypothetical protein
MELSIELEKEDGRWVAEIKDWPGVMIYGTTRKEVLEKIKAAAFRASVNGHIDSAYASIAEKKVSETSVYQEASAVAVAQREGTTIKSEKKGLEEK